MRKELGQINFEPVDVEKIRDLVQEKKDKVDNNFNAELEHAVQFCNGSGALSKDKKKYCDQIKKHLAQ